MQKLKPAIFIGGADRSYNSPKYFQQNIVLKMLPYADSLNELRKMAGIKSNAEVIRTLDKLAIRQEYHRSLADNQLSLDYIVKGLKEVCDTTSSDKVKSNTLFGLLRSLGLEKYEAIEQGGGSWEDIMLKIMDKQEATKKDGVKNSEIIDGEYEVIQPETPPEEVERRRKNTEIEKSIYE